VVGYVIVHRSAEPPRVVVLGTRSEPQPDLAVLRHREDRYRYAHPVADDTHLLIEVADITARFDREVKIPPYARHSIPEVWLVDLEAGTFETYREPRVGAYQSVVSCRGGTVSPPAFPQVEVDVAVLLGQGKRTVQSVARFATAGPGELQREAQRRQRGGQPRRLRRQPELELRGGG